MLATVTKRYTYHEIHNGHSVEYPHWVWLGEEAILYNVYLMSLIVVTMIYDFLKHLQYCRQKSRRRVHF